MGSLGETLGPKTYLDANFFISSFLTNDSRLKIPGLRVLGWRDLETFISE